MHQGWPVRIHLRHCSWRPELMCRKKKKTLCRWYVEASYHAGSSLLQSVTLHTTLGDIKVEVFCDRTPMAAYVRKCNNGLTWKNFLALCASGYYDGCLFHRNIKEFMVQTGDPTGTGKGGQSIFGKLFNDEIVDGLEVSRWWSLLTCSMRGGPCQWQTKDLTVMVLSSSFHTPPCRTWIRNTHSLEGRERVNIFLIL